MMEKAGPCPDKRYKTTYSSSSKLRRPPWIHMCRKTPWRSKREGITPHSKWCQPPISLFTRLHLGWGMSTDTWADPEIYQIRPQNQANQNQAKETWKRWPPKWFKPPWGCKCLSSHVCLSTWTVLFFLLINTLLVSLLSVFVAVLSCKAEEPEPCH